MKTDLHPYPIPCDNLSMAGHIRTLQKCPKCKGRFQGQPLHCPTCLTHPTRYFIDFWWRGRKKIYTDSDGHALDSWRRTFLLLATITEQIEKDKFDPADYVAQELKNLQFNNYVATWLKRRQLELERRHISRGYFNEIKRYTRTYFEPFFAKRNIRDLRTGDISDFKNWLPPHLSSKTTANILGVLRKLFRDALDRNDVAVIPRFPTMPKTEPRTKWITEAEQERVLKYCREPYRTLFLLLMKHGCRTGEGRALKWPMLDLKAGIVTIAASFDRGTWKPYTKERDVRVLPLHSQVRAALLALPRSLSGFVFVNRQGRPLSDTRVRTAWIKAAARAGVDVNSYQGTRHSFATQKLIAGHSERKVMEVTGHKTTAAFRRYGKLVTEALRDVIESKEAHYERG